MSKLSIAPIKNFFLDLLFPVRCLICLKSSPPTEGQEDYVCSSCLEKVKFKVEPECTFCSSRSLNGQTCPFCRQDHYLDFLWAAADYEESIVKKALWAFKYRFIKDLQMPLANLLEDYLRRKKIDKLLENYHQQILLVPIPLHQRRFNWRSYNQSQLLAQSLAKKFNLKMENNVLLRLKHKTPQAELKDKRERTRNSKNIFACPRSDLVQGKVVILVDDISTTGSTLDEAARILKKSGAEKVIGLVVAKG